MIRPDAQLRAGHRPAELIPDGVHPAHVTVIYEAPRSYAGPILLTLVASVGAAGVIALVLALLQVAATVATAVAAAAPAVGGATLTISLRKKG